MEKWQLVSTSIILPIIVNLVSHILEKLVDERLKSDTGVVDGIEIKYLLDWLLEE